MDNLPKKFKTLEFKESDKQYTFIIAHKQKDGNYRIEEEHMKEYKVNLLIAKFSMAADFSPKVIQEDVPVKDVITYMQRWEEKMLQSFEQWVETDEKTGLTVKPEGILLSAQAGTVPKSHYKKVAHDLGISTETKPTPKAKAFKHLPTNLRNN